MSGTVNIRRDVKDAFYRYKMPKIQSKIEGKGNGIKTVVSNMTEVAKALNRPATYVTKFFGTELGSIVHCDDKTGRYIVNGAHDADKLASLLDIFIAKFVLCQACENPETELSASKDGTVWRSCKACGHRSTVDMLHKLVAFIQKNPPPKPRKLVKDPQDLSGTADDDNQTHEGEEGMVAPEGMEDEFDKMKQTSQLDDDWADVGAVRDAELAGLSASVRDTLRVNSPTGDPIEEFGEYLMSSGQSVESEDILANVNTLQVPIDKAVAILVQFLLDTPSVSQTLSSRVSLFKELISTIKEQKAFLGGLERLVGLHRPDLLKLFPGLLQFSYNQDLISEEAILDWNEHVSKRYMTDKTIGRRVRDAAAPFIKWLGDDFEESGSD